MAPLKAFADLGFSDTEARIYCELLRSGPSTGYRLAASIGKAAANIYQGLEALRLRGAVMVEEKGTRIFRAVPPKELVAVLDREFQRRSSAALASLQEIETARPDDRLYHLKTVAQMAERGRSMIKAAQEIILFDLYPGPLDMFRADLERAASRKVVVAGVAYGGAPELQIAHLYRHPSKMIWKRWPGQQITLVADATEYLVALLSSDGNSLAHGSWSDSPYLSCLQHSGLASEIQAAAMVKAMPPPLARLNLLDANPAGLRHLLGRSSKPIPRFGRRKTG